MEELAVEVKEPFFNIGDANTFNIMVTGSKKLTGASLLGVLQTSDRWNKITIDPDTFNNDELATRTTVSNRSAAK
jgi:hypothetical protein